jgi:REP element-mobilizing transposase RayT
MEKDSTGPFFPFDSDAEIEIYHRKRPHWFQAGVATFVTFRTADSIPRQVLNVMADKFEHWLLTQKLDPAIASVVFGNFPDRRKAFLDGLPLATRLLLGREFHHLFNTAMDACHGACELKRPEIAKIVSDAILFFNSNRYDLDSFVIMPNHVHAIVQFRDGYNLSVVGQSWMRYTARQINRILNRQGMYWFPEPFDHIIRDDDHFSYYRQYIASNPKSARLKSGEYTLWDRMSSFPSSDYCPNSPIKPATTTRSNHRRPASQGTEPDLSGL